MKRVLAGLVIGVALCLVSFEMAYGEGNDSYTKLLLHCNGEDGAKAHKITANGTAQLDTAAKKFGTASLLLDGDSDSITAADSADWDIVGSSIDNWTIDFWVKHDDHVGNEYYLHQKEDETNRWGLHHLHGYGIEFWGQSSGNYKWVTGYGGEITDTNWHHVALCKVGSKFGIYKDGVQINYVDDSTTDTFAGILYIGVQGLDGNYFDGSMDEIRTQHSNYFGANPVAGLTDTITAPHAAFIPDDNTKLLIHADGTDSLTNFYDHSGIIDSSFGGDHKEIVAEGDAQVDTAQKKFGTGSGLFDGTGDYLTVPDSDDWALGTGDFTVDWRVRFASTVGAQTIFSQVQDTDNRDICYFNSNTLTFAHIVSGVGVVLLGINWTPSIDTWYHVELDKVSNTYTFYINGVGIDSHTDATAISNFAAVLTIGKDPDGGGAFLNGWLDEFRWSKGIARHTANFTPPTSEYTVNTPPTAFSLTAPLNLTSTNSNKPIFSWGAATDPESLPITYTLKLSTTAGFTEPVYRAVSGLSTTSHTPAEGNEIGDNSYYWKVIASDGEKETESSETWQVTVDTQKPDIPQFTGFFANPDGSISKIYGTGENGTTVAYYDKNNNIIPGTTEWNGGNFTFTPTTPLDPGSSVYVTSRDGASNISQSKTKVVTFEAYDDIFKDDTTFHGGLPGTSVRMEKDTSYEFDIAVNAGEEATVHAWMKYNSEYDGSGADAPRITLSGLGITTGNTAGMTAPASYTPGTWEELTVSGTPNAKGVVTLTVETFSTADGAAAWVDDISVSQ